MKRRKFGFPSESGLRKYSWTLQSTSTEKAEAENEAEDEEDVADDEEDEEALGPNLAGHEVKMQFSLPAYTAYPPVR